MSINKTEKTEFVKSKEVVQSRVLTTAKYDYDIAQKRVLYRIVEFLQVYTQGIKLQGKYTFEELKAQGYLVDELLYGFKQITMPIKVFLNSEGSKNYQQVYKAFKGLTEKKFDYDDGNKIKLIRVIEKPIIVRNSSIVTFELHEEIFDVFLNFSKGFSKYELTTAMSFRSEYTMRFYELLYNQVRPIEFKLDTLREMFALGGKYASNKDFIRSVVIKAQKELKEKAHFTFNIEKTKEGRETTKLTFTKIATENPHPMPKNEKLGIMNNHKLSLSSVIGNDVKRALIEEFNFNEQGIKNNLEMLQIAKTLGYDLIDFIFEIKKSIRKQELEGKVFNSYIGYFVKAVQTKNDELLKKSGKLAQRNAFGGIDII